MKLPTPANDIIFVKNIVIAKADDAILRSQDRVHGEIVAVGQNVSEVFVGYEAILENYCYYEVSPGIYACSTKNLVAYIPKKGKQECTKKSCDDLFAKTTKHIEGLVQAIKTVYGEKNDKVALNPTRQGIFGEISAERDYQDKKWGGPAIDDTRSYQDFVNWINEYGNGRGRAANYDCRTRMIKTAALAVAAIESMDRKNKCDNNGCDDE